VSEPEVAEALAGDVEAVLECLRSGWLTMGPRIQGFEREFAAHVGSEEAVAVSSGTAALHLAALAAGLGPGSEAIVPAVAGDAARSAVALVGGAAVTCDVDEEAPALDPEAVQRALGPRTRAVIAVHPWGYPAPAAALRVLCEDHGVTLIEDCCDAVGAALDDAGTRAGSVGHLACFSLSPARQLAVGEGGMVTGTEAELLARVRSLRSHAMTSVTWDRHRGHADSYDVVDLGFNYRMDEPRAALGLSRLPRLDAELDARRIAVAAARPELAEIPGVRLAWGEAAAARAAHAALPLVLGDGAGRDAVLAALQAGGLPAEPAAQRLCAVRLDPAAPGHGLPAALAALRSALGG